MSTATSLKAYLEGLTTASGPPAGPIVMGNESADLDSMASALLYAFLRYQLGERGAVPLLNIPREDMALRPEMAFTLGRAALLPALVPTLTEVDPTTVDAPMVLVDHNVPSHGQASLTPRITGILDHHVDEHAAPHAQPRIIERVGSCTSLVLREWSRAAKQHAALVDVFDAACLHLALAPLLVDTANFDPAADRGTDVDRDALAWCQTLPSFALLRLDLHTYFRDVEAAKANVASLAPRDLLRKDYKEWSLRGSTITLGISSIPCPMEAWERRDGADGIVSAIRAWAEERSLDYHLAMMSHVAPDGFHRELSLYIRDPTSATLTPRQLSEATTTSLGLDPISPPDAPITWWRQRITRPSRKQVAPIVRGLIEGRSNM